MQTQLFIENYEIELDDSVQFCLNKQFDELSNPTTIINDWSKTVSIPFTAHNNKIFGYLYKPERIILGTNNPSGYKSMGIYFDPTKKLDFRLVYNTTTLMSGYAKVNTVKQSKGKGTYEVTLFGQLGKIFQELNKITFNVNDENTDYIIDGNQYIDASINKSLVVSSWNSTGQTHSTLTGATFTDILGFAPNNSYYEEFDPKTFQYDTAASNLFTDTLKSKWDDENGGYVTGIDPESAIPNGMLPRDIGEFRSYYQTPFIYWNKLWQIFQKKAESISGYTWDLDSDWFTTSNPYWYKLVYMLKPFNVKNGTSLENHYTKWGSNAAIDRSLGRSTTPGSPAKVLKMMMPSDTYDCSGYKNEAYKLLMTYGDIGAPEYDDRYPHYPTDVAVFRCPEDFTSITFKWVYTLLIETPGSCHFKDNAGLTVSIKMWGCDNWRTPTVGARLVQTNNYIIRHENSGYTYSDYTPVDTGTSPDSGSARYKLYPTFNSNFAASYAKCGPYCYFTIETAYTASEPFQGQNMGSLGYNYLQQSTTCDVVMSSGAFRTGVHFTLNDLWDNNYNLFEQILNYCKMYRILIFVDDMNKKLKFIRANKYFRSYTITDWSDKLDMSKDFTITPLTFENKYVIFNYDNNESKLGKKYKESWGVNYGDKKLVTQYNFNDKDKKLFDKKITTSMTNTDFSLSWTNLYDYNKISYSLPAEIFPYSKDKDNKSINNFGAFYFHNGRRSFDTTAALHMRGVTISDDTTFQQSNDTYYYSQSQDGTSVSYYPALDIVYSDNEKLCLFNKPNENYTYAKNLSETQGIYDMFWKMYIDERYNIQNKQITCYLKLLPKDFINFEYNNFIKINDVIYIVNKIYDYDVTSSQSTKVDLVTVSSISGYYVDYFSDYLNISPESIVLDGSTGTQDITVSAYNNEWNYELLDGEGNPIITTDITLTKVNNNTLRVTKNGDYSLNYLVRIFTITHSKTVGVTGARGPYFIWYPTSLITRKGYSDEFDIRVETNYKTFDLIANSTVQWLNSSSVWKTTAFTATSSTVPGWASGESSSYNEAHADRVATIHIKIVNPTADGNVTLFCPAGAAWGGWPDPESPYEYHYIPYHATDGIYVTNSNGEYTAEDSVEYHGVSAIRGYNLVSDSAWSCQLPQGVRSYGPTNGDAGTTSVTFDWGSGEPNTSKTITFTNSNSKTFSLVCNYVTQ